MRTFEKKPQNGKTPMEPRVNDLSIDLVNRPYRALSSVKPISLYVDPNTQAADAPTEYKFINRTNRATEANYPGQLNSSGHIMDVLPNSRSSISLDYFDNGCMELRFKYQFLAISASDNNQAANEQMTKSINEALARVSSESYTDLAFFKDDHYGSMLYCDSSTDPDHPKRYLNTLVYYQTFLQNIASIIARYQFLLANEDNMIHMGYNRESSAIVDLMGRFKKKAFLSKISSLNHTIKSNYFDRAWWRQINTIVCNASKKSDSVREPALWVNGVHEMPTECYMKTSDNVTYFNATDYRIDITAADGLPSAWIGTGQPMERVIDHIVSMMSPFSIIEWCRQYSEGTLDPTATPFVTPNRYFDGVNTLIDKIFAKLGKFSADSADIKTMLDVANRSGMNRWQLGVMIDIDTKAKYELTFNKLIYDLYRCAFGSTRGVTYDSKTQRWTFKTLWDEYLGVPEFNKINGGSFLTFSCLNVPGSTSPTDPRYLIPVMFKISKDTSKASAFFIDRHGNRVNLESKPDFDFSAALPTNRLKLLDDREFDKIAMPYINVWDNILVNASCIQYLMSDLFGYGGLMNRNPATIDDDHPVLDTDIYGVQVHASLVGFIDVEMSDVSNDLIAYYQAYAPLKVYSSTLERTIGFTDIPRFN